MVGNLCEWCLDWSGDADDYADYAYASVDVPEENPYGPAKSDSGGSDDSGEWASHGKRRLLCQCARPDDLVVPCADAGRSGT